ncbi:hypothetical protein M6B38_275435 [Iris pallida]|uniref:Uncharacterized protein n=1 Tax=Iris pallida TaxID=29817 RepID=A0AAX6E3V3_IRIPA|nr:hypothetical protein M6B38_210635 [Iris pallida]KAJ6848630.1 hypothetical protein M6B38_275435 [Iris pallida]
MKFLSVSRRAVIGVFTYTRHNVWTSPSEASVCCKPNIILCYIQR